MPALRPDQCWQDFGPLDIGPALAELYRLPFRATNMGSTKPTKCPCFTVPAGAPLPDAVVALIDTVIAKLGGETARFVLRKLGPRQGMAPHIDAILPAETDWRRFQLPLLTDPKIVMRWTEDGQELHLAAGHLYEVRVDRLHEVVNAADVERVHLQIDQVGATL
jgi:hypothetical protein